MPPLARLARVPTALGLAAVLLAACAVTDLDETPPPMGRFLLGSTIVMLFRPGTITFNPDWAPEGPVRLGEMMGMHPS